MDGCNELQRARRRSRAPPGRRARSASQARRLLRHSLSIDLARRVVTCEISIDYTAVGSIRPCGPREPWHPWGRPVRPPSHWPLGRSAAPSTWSCRRRRRSARGARRRRSGRRLQRRARRRARRRRSPAGTPTRPSCTYSGRCTSPRQYIRYTAAGTLTHPSSTYAPPSHPGRCTSPRRVTRYTAAAHPPIPVAVPGRCTLLVGYSVVPGTPTHPDAPHFSLHALRRYTRYGVGGRPPGPVALVLGVAAFSSVYQYTASAAAKTWTRIQAPVSGSRRRAR